MMKSFTHRQQGDRGEKLYRFSFGKHLNLIVIFSEYIDMAVMSYYAIRQELVTTKYEGKIDENGRTL